ncbi:MAG TPA: HD domain-containing phosphohydrolase [Solirubrobacteraceae bacterium]|nr:HD domain-containing phosphohydrolase [Solirubrobacteraceae bacterium]
MAGIASRKEGGAAQRAKRERRSGAPSAHVREAPSSNGAAAGLPARNGAASLLALSGNGAGLRSHAEAPVPASEFEAQLEPAALLRYSGSGVVGVTREGLIGSWNHGAEVIYGYTRQEAIGQPVTIISPPGRAAEMEALIASVLAGRTTEEIEAERRAKDGTLRFVRMVISPVRGADGEIVGTAAVVRDITEQKRAEAELVESEERYRSVVEALHDGIRIVDREGKTIGMNASALRILQAEERSLRDARTDQRTSLLIHEDGSPYRADEIPTERVLRTGEPISGAILGYVRAGGEVRWLEINCAPLFRPGESEPYAAVSSFSDITAQKLALGALESARLEDLKRLALLSEFRDDETKRHTERVARAAQLVAVQLGMDENYVWMIGRAAPLHDVGKVGIPDSILLKPGPLTDEEFRVMKSHTSIGGQILAESDFHVLQMGMEIALTHHERFDGGGYPRGLRGEEIPLCGRIVAVADAFDAMTHKRPYKDEVPAAEAAAELRRCAGTQFDPRVVEAFLRLDFHALVDAPEPRAQR